MKFTFTTALIFQYVGCLLLQETAALRNYSEPILAVDYSKELGYGFTTNWFKSYPPLSKYNSQNIKDVSNAGFRHLRLRSRADLYDAPYNDTKSETFFTNLTSVVDDCIKENVFPVITWIHHAAEAYATEDDMQNYLQWWRKVAQQLKDRDYRLSFNVFTELGVDECQKTGNCAGSLKLNKTKYNTWTSRVVKAIRESGGNNEKRIIIITSPKKTAKGLALIEKEVYQNDSYMMAEFHIYASGPNKKENSPKYWVGNGTKEQRQTLVDEIEMAKRDIALPLYFGAWMPQDNNYGELRQCEVQHFARYFVQKMKQENISSALNVLDVYYDTKASTWITGPKNITNQILYMSNVLDVIKKEMTS